MRRRPTLASPILVAVLACLAGCDPGAAPARAPGTTRRIVTLTPSATELVAALGASSLIVGVDQFSAHPPQVRSLPKVGDFLSPSLDAILSLHPDIAVVDAVQSEVAATLKQAGIQVISLPMQTTADVRAGLLALGAALDRGAAARAEVARLDAVLASAAAEAERALARTGRRPRALFIVDRQIGGLGGMVGAGPGTHLDELLRLAGADNVLADSPVRYAKLSPEEVIARHPDVILDAVHTNGPGGPARARADWQTLAAAVPAVARGHVYVLNDPMFVSPGPRLGDSLRRLQPLLWAEPASDAPGPSPQPQAIP